MSEGISTISACDHSVGVDAFCGIGYIRLAEKRIVHFVAEGLENTLEPLFPTLKSPKHGKSVNYLQTTIKNGEPC